MINKEINERINRELDELYKSCSAEFLAEWSCAFRDTAPDFLNNFGIVDEERYDSDNGILFIGKETNNFSHAHYRDWLVWLSRQTSIGGTDITPNMWYNAGRWACLAKYPERDVHDIAALKADALRFIGTIAFTNVNKVYGKNQSKEEYYRVALSDVAGKLLRREIEIIKPKTIVCCGTGDIFLRHVQGFGGKIIFMPHPGARKNTEAMLYRLKEQM